jgi:hypothetical protein
MHCSPCPAVQLVCTSTAAAALPCALMPVLLLRRPCACIHLLTVLLLLLLLLCRTVLAPRVTTPEAISASQRTAPALELLTAEVSEAMDAARRRRKHAAKRAMLNMMRSSKWLLEKVAIAAAAAAAHQDTAVASSG